MTKAKDTALATTNGQERKLPSLDELRNEAAIDSLEKTNQLNVLLNEPPFESWLRPHPYAKRKVVKGKEIVEEAAVYLPIERQEWLLTRIFVDWHVEVLNWNLIANSVGCTVRLHYRNPVSSEFQWMDGVGAVPLQTDKGAGATDFNKIKSSAVQMALPAAKSYAFKDAVETLGKFFGKDVNRLGEVEYYSMLTQFDSAPLSAKEIVRLSERFDKLSDGQRRELLEYFLLSDIADVTRGRLKEVDSRITDMLAHHGT